jgi:hypothetical protein
MENYTITQRDIENAFAQAIFFELDSMPYGEESYLFVDESEDMKFEDKHYKHYGFKYVDILRNGGKLHYNIDGDKGFITIEDVHNIAFCGEEDIDYLLTALEGDWHDSFTSCAIIQLAILGYTI